MKYSDLTRPTPDETPHRVGSCWPDSWRTVGRIPNLSDPVQASHPRPFHPASSESGQVALRWQCGIWYLLVLPPPPPPFLHTPTIPIPVSSQPTKKQIKPLKKNKQNTEIPSHASSPHQSVFSTTKQVPVRPPPQERFVVASSEALYLP